MAVEGTHLDITIVAGEDLSSYQYHVVDVDGTRSTASLGAVGIVQNAPASGEHAAVAYAGNMKAKAGGTITKGASVVLTASGTLAVGSNGVVGRAMAAASSGSIFQLVGMFPTATNSG